MIYYITTFILLLGLDLGTKHLVQQHIPLYQVIPVVPGWLNLTHIKNPGAAFGFMAQSSYIWRMILFYGISFVAIIVMGVMFFKCPNDRRWFKWGLLLILAGAVGNQIDRLRLGAVVDFIDIYYRNWHWPAFNVADSAICIGAALLLLDAGQESAEKCPVS